MPFEYGGASRTPPPTPPLRQRCALPPLPGGEASSHQCGCRQEHGLAPPPGELSPQVTERDEHGNAAVHNYRENTCRGRPPDVPRIITTASFLPVPPKVRCTFNNISPFPGEGGEGDGVLQHGCRLYKAERRGRRPLHPLSVSAARCHLSRGERQERTNTGAGGNTAWLPLRGSCHRR